MKNVQATGEQPSKENTQQKYISSLFWGYFCPPGLFLPTWIRIQPAKINADPDPQHCFYVCTHFLILRNKYISEVLNSHFQHCDSTVPVYVRLYFTQFPKME